MAIINGTNGNDTLTGTADDDTISPLLGLDQVDGNDGTDRLVVDYSSIDGSGGDHAYLTISNFFTGSGLIQTNNNQVTFTKMEALDITGTGGDDTLIAWALQDTIRGGPGNDFINGGTGSDSIDGGLGQDTLEVDRNVSEPVTINGLPTLPGTTYTGIECFEIITGTGDDTISLTTSVGDTILSGAGNDSISAGSGNDWIDGETGNDTMAGGLGDDTFYIDSAGDLVTEASSAGTDLVKTMVSGYTLAANVENLILSGAVISGIGNGEHNQLTGNSAANSLTGGAGHDTLNGSSGNDTLAGESGDDVYAIDVLTDTVTEGSNAGTDRVHASVTGYTLPVNVENLTLNGSVIAGTGNSSPNYLTGNAAANVLNGAGGNDTLNGGAGDDSLNGGANDDTYLVDAAGDVVSEAGGSGTDQVYSAVTYTLVADVENLLLTGSDDINGTGNTLANSLTGNAGANILDGGFGGDKLSGGAGNDTYIVDNAGDTITEAALAGDDTVRSGVTYTLANHVDDLILTGAGAINGTGNTLANSLTGNSAANTLDGSSGADQMDGAGGNDTYIVDNGADAVSETDESGGNDTVRAGASHTLGANIENLVMTGSGPYTAIGNALSNKLTGNGANNVLNGGAGADTTTGGEGNDIYVINSFADVLVESADGGVDRINAPFSFTLPANFEELVLTNSSAITGTGNSANNEIYGSSAANTLDGKAGQDSMDGGPGNDTYIVETTGDRVRESDAVDGIDTVRSSVTFYLSNFVENLILTGTAAINGTGNDRRNELTGNSAANILDGRTLTDTLIGGAGDDTYIVDRQRDVVTESANSGQDTVKAAAGYILGPNLETLILTGTAVSDGVGNSLANRMDGNDAANKLTGDLGDDTLLGDGGLDTLFGAQEASFGEGEIDQLTGGADSDKFVLGIAEGRFYDNGEAGTGGRSDYAHVTDFTVGVDVLQLNGSRSEYYLGTSGVSGVSGRGLFHEDGATDELIAIVRSGNSTALTDANTIDVARFM